MSIEPINDFVEPLIQLKAHIAAIEKKLILNGSKELTVEFHDKIHSDLTSASCCIDRLRNWAYHNTEA